MSSFYIAATVWPGSDISQTCVDLMILAKRLGVTIRSEFNGVTLLACPDGTPEKLEREWRSESEKPATIYRCARS